MRFLCDKDKKQKSVEVICSEWFDFMLEHASSRPPYPNPWAAAGFGSNGQVGAAAAAPARPNVMEYDDHGAPVDPRQTCIESQGILPGARVRHIIHGAPHEVIEVSARGGVVLKQVRADGTLACALKSVPYDGFLSNYVFDDRASTAYMRWPDVDIGQSKMFEVEYHRCRIFAAMFEFYNDVDVVQLTIQQEPHRAVFVDAQASKNKLCLPLASTKLGAYQDTDGDMAWKVFPTGSQATASEGPEGTCYCFCSTGFKGQFAAAWAIKTVTEEKDANCIIKLKQPPSDGPYEDIRLPFVTNIVALKKGDELKIFKKPKEIKKPEPSLKRHLNASSVAGHSSMSRPRRG